MAEPPQYKEKQTILPHPISNEDSKKTPCKRTYEGKAKKSEAKKLMEMEGHSRRSSESGTDHDECATTKEVKDDLDSKPSTPTKKKTNKDEPSKIDMRKMVIEHNMINKVVTSISTVTAPATEANRTKEEGSAKKTQSSSELVHKEKKEKRRKDATTSSTDTPKKLKLQSTDTPAVSLSSATNAITTNTLSQKIKLPETVPTTLPMPPVPPTPFTHREAYVNSLNQKEPEIKIQVQLISDEPQPTATAVCIAAATPSNETPTTVQVVSRNEVKVLHSSHIINSVEEALVQSSAISVQSEEVVMLSQPQLVIDHEEEVVEEEIVETVVEPSTNAATSIQAQHSTNYPPLPPMPPLPALPPPLPSSSLLNAATSAPLDAGIIQMKSDKTPATTATNSTKSQKHGGAKHVHKQKSASTDLISSIMASMDNSTANHNTSKSAANSSLGYTTSTH